MINEKMLVIPINEKSTTVQKSNLITIPDSKIDEGVKRDQWKQFDWLEYMYNEKRVAWTEGQITMDQKSKLTPTLKLTNG